MVFFQETHCDRKSERVWSNEFGNDIYWSNGTSQSRGVAIAMNKKVAKCIESVHRDVEGHYVILTCLIEGLMYTFCNIYAPNTDEPNWFNARTYTWMNRTDGNWSRIDYFLVSESLSVKCEDVKIVPSICTDHSAVSILINIGESKRGPGIWKFNNELLKDNTFCMETKNLIAKTGSDFSYLCGKDLWEVL